MEKTGLEINELFKDENDLIKKHIKGKSSNQLELFAERKSISDVFIAILNKAKNIDTTLEPLVKGETQRTLNNINKIEKKIMKAEKRHHNDYVRQIESLKEILFPGGGPQERILNFLHFYLEDPEFINKILSSLSAFDLRFHVIIDGRE